MHSLVSPSRRVELSVARSTEVPDDQARDFDAQDTECGPVSENEVQDVDQKKTGNA